MLERITYVSRAAAGLSREDLHGIIRAAHGFNRAAGITGALVYLDGWFAQLLEGGSAAVDRCLERLSRDPRHGRISRLSRERGFSRLFPDQAMALRSRACLDEGLLADFDYRPGFPVEKFPVDVLVVFMWRACHRADGAGTYARAEGAWVRRPAEGVGAYAHA